MAFEKTEKKDKLTVLDTLANPADVLSSRQLSVLEVKEIRDHLEDKLPGVKIHISGEHASVSKKWEKYNEQNKNDSYTAGMKKRGTTKKEIQAIQGELADGEYVGYIFTNGEEKENKHFEVAIVGKEGVVKPLNWMVDELSTIDYCLDPFRSSKESTAVYAVDFPGISTARIVPQAGQKECATLGLLYLKELLKDNSKLMKDFSLSFNANGNSYFFPPPQTLRYSQSQYYNKCLRAMLEDGEQIAVVHGEKKTTVTSLKTLLEGKLPANQPYLDKFDEFKQAWIKAYDEAMEKRNKMQPSESKINHYLAYKTLTIGSKNKLFITKGTGSQAYLEKLKQREDALRTTQPDGYYLLEQRQIPGGIDFEPAKLFYVNKQHQKIELSCSKEFLSQFYKDTNARADDFLISINKEWQQELHKINNQMQTPAKQTTQTSNVTQPVKQKNAQTKEKAAPTISISTQPVKVNELIEMVDAYIQECKQDQQDILYSLSGIRDRLSPLFGKYDYKTKILAAENLKKLLNGEAPNFTSTELQVLTQDGSKLKQVYDEVKNHEESLQQNPTDELKIDLN